MHKQPSIYSNERNKKDTRNQSTLAPDVATGILLPEDFTIDDKYFLTKNNPMDRDTYFQKLKENYDYGIEIMSRKNHDYAGVDDPFKNFKAAEIIGLTVEEGIMLRLSDKFARLGNLLKRKAQVNDESFADTAIDAMNYLNILLVYREQKQSLEKVIGEVAPVPMPSGPRGPFKGLDGGNCVVADCFDERVKDSLYCPAHREYYRKLPLCSEGFCLAKTNSIHDTKCADHIETT